MQSTPGERQLSRWDKKIWYLISPLSPLRMVKWKSSLIGWAGMKSRLMTGKDSSIMSLSDTADVCQMESRFNETWTQNFNQVAESFQLFQRCFLFRNACFMITGVKGLLPMLQINDLSSEELPPLSMWATTPDLHISGLKRSQPVAPTTWY